MEFPQLLYDALFSRFTPGQAVIASFGLLVFTILVLRRLNAFPKKTSFIVTDHDVTITKNTGEKIVIPKNDFISISAEITTEVFENHRGGIFSGTSAFYYLHLTVKTKQGQIIPYSPSQQNFLLIREALKTNGYPDIVNADAVLNEKMHLKSGRIPPRLLKHSTLFGIIIIVYIIIFCIIAYFIVPK